ncbi:MAG: ABC transporter substrate-binding protein [Proteobacteria bacterium]|nr:ABC transporter substrate-binding protein [Pseudomonadota bacterium]
MKLGIGRLLAAAGLALAVAMGTLAGASAQQSRAVKIFGASATVEAYHGFLFLGIPLGFYRDQGVDAEFGTAAGSAATLQLVATNQAQVGYIGMEVLVLAKAKNPDLPVTAVYLHDRGNIYEIVVPEESDIKSIADLKDKNIGVANLASGAIPALRAILADSGLNPDTSVGLIPVGNGAAAAAALRANRVQALSLFRAQHAVIETLGFRFRYFQREQPSAVLIVNTNFMRQNPDAVAATLRGVIMGSTFAQVNPQATVREHWKMFGRPTGISEDEAMSRAVHVLRKSSELWKNYENQSVAWGAMTKQQWDGLQDFLVKQRLLEKAIDSDALFTSQFIEPINKLDLAPVIQRARGM